MINQIEYTDKNHPVAGCGFLLDTGDEILAATAKHILTYFKSETMESVSFQKTLKLWKMFPKNNPDDVVVIDLIAVDKNHRRKNTASSLIAYAESEYNNCLLIRVGTQIANIASVRLYEKLGFRLTQSQYIFHYHR